MEQFNSSPLLKWQSYPFPIDWPVHFEQEVCDLQLEIGFGDGRYTVSAALRKPKTLFVGLEISNASIKRALKRINTEKIQNVYILKVFAEFAVQHLFGPDSLTSIVVNFPDPWPKKKHRENRLLKSSFFQLAASRLKSQGKICLATDHQDYFHFAQEEAKSTGLYDLNDGEPPKEVFKTRYALKWQKQGKPLYYQEFQWKGLPSLDYPILTRDKIMPHTILQGKLPQEIPFERKVFPYVQGHVILHEVGKSWGVNEQGRLLVRVTVDEPNLRQQVLVIIRQRQENEVLVGFESFGDPIITETTRGAIHGVTEWLLDLQQGLTVVKRNY